MVISRYGEVSRGTAPLRSDGVTSRASTSIVLRRSVIRTILTL
jgi:hypothetical protein